MTKKYAPPVPDVSFHRPADRDYFVKLLEVAGLSQRKAGPLLGFDERSVRNKLAGKSDFTYPEQYCLEVLADAKASPQEGAVHEEAPGYGVELQTRTVWHHLAKRPLQGSDVGKVLVGQDRFGTPIHGTLVKDGFGLVIKAAADGLDVHQTPIDRVALYTLLDPPGQR